MLTKPLSSNASQSIAAANQQRGGLVPQQTLANRLGERLGLAPGALNKPASEFTPDKVANRMLSFIEQRLQGSAGDSKAVAGLLQQAREGIKQGFEEATKILDGMGMLQGKVAEDINKTRALIDEGMAGLEQRFLGGSPGEKPAAPSAAGAGGYSERMAARLDTFDLKVTTRDGDKLRISIAEGAASWSQQAGGVQSSGSVQMGRWQIEIEGELDAGEREALGKLLGQVEELSSSFFSGDLAGAFDQALALNMDGEQLASMSLNLTQTQVRQVSESYGQVAKQGGQSPSAVNSELLEYARGLIEALRSADSLVDNGREFLERLLEGGLAMDGRVDEAGWNKAGRLNSMLLDGLAGMGAGKGPDAA